MRIYALVSIILFFCLLPVAIKLDRRAKTLKMYRSFALSVELLQDAFKNFGEVAVLAGVSFKKLNESWNADAENYRNIDGYLFEEE